MSLLVEIIDRLATIKSARDTIRAKLVNFGLAMPESKLEQLSTQISLIDKYSGSLGNMDGSLTYTIPKGYHDGTSSIDVVPGASSGGSGSGVPGDPTYIPGVTVVVGKLQPVTVTAKSTTQTITPDAGYVGFSEVTVNPTSTGGGTIGGDMSELLALLATV